ncbi:hypothetical protein BTE77_05985 [Ensifer adhaerens]|nr:hypothetical protein BTE77_05985 [Ensifer adhaerens]
MIEWSWNAATVPWLATAGIIWDLSGAIALVRGFFFTSDRQLEQQFGSYWGANPSAYRAFFEQRLDTRFGLTHLILGFSLQLLASLGLRASFGAALLIISPIIISWFAFQAGRSYRAAFDAVRLSVTLDAQEEVWRQHFSDLSEIEWKRIVWNQGITFQKPAPASA